jgi:ABC-2 type transport system permease protein
MKKCLAIAGKELKIGFTTPLAYVVMSGFLLLSGFFFFTLLQQFQLVLERAMQLPNENPSLNEWVVVPYYQTLEIILIFLIPILTMRSLSEERQRGTFELLATSPVSASQIVLGKYFGTASMLFIMLLLSFTYPAVLILFSDPEVMPILVGFLGLTLFALGFVALGVAISAFSKNQTIAGFVTLVVLLVFYVVDAPADRLDSVSASILNYLTPSSHTEGMLKGVLTGVDVVYFLSLISLGLFVANRALDAERWR